MLFQVVPRIEALPRPWRLGRQRVDDPGYHFTGQGRDGYCVFQYTLAGCGRFRHGDQEWDLPPGTGFLCDIQDPGYAYGLAPHAHWHFLYLQMLAPATAAMVADINRHHGHVFALPLERGIIRHLRRWLDTGFDGVLSAAAGKRLIDQLLDAVLESAHVPDEGNVHLDRALRAIQADPARPLDATVLAREIGVSREHLTRLFRHHLGQSPYAYIIEHRVHRAAWSLHHDSTSVAAVAAGNGFSSPELMCRCFQRVLGCSPSQWRTRPAT